MRICRSLVWSALLSLVLSNIALAEVAERAFAAVDYQRKTIYHSPQSPGYACWVYTWLMPEEPQAMLAVVGNNLSPEWDGVSAADRNLTGRLARPICHVCR